MSYVTAKRIEDVIRWRFEQFGFPFRIDSQLIPDDESTLFVCSGMQRHKSRFKDPDGTHDGSLQSCLRTNDLELVGDGSHLTYFEMMGNFSFGGNDYPLSVELWDTILRDLKIPVSHITVHPTQTFHRHLWEKRGYRMRPELGCEWSDGEIGGFCCEVFVGELEIGNLVNPLGHSTDVGFGWERLHQIVEGVERIHESSLFPGHPSPIVADHSRAIEELWRAGISPGAKGRHFVCRRLIRRMLDHLSGEERFAFDPWLEQERTVREKSLRTARRCWRKFRNHSAEFWRETFGVLPEEIVRLQ